METPKLGSSQVWPGSDLGKNTLPGLGLGLVQVLRQARVGFGILPGLGSTQSEMYLCLQQTPAALEQVEVYRQEGDVIAASSPDFNIKTGKLEAHGVIHIDSKAYGFELCEVYSEVLAIPAIKKQLDLMGIEVASCIDRVAIEKAVEEVEGVTHVFANNIRNLASYVLKNSYDGMSWDQWAKLVDQSGFVKAGWQKRLIDTEVMTNFGGPAGFESLQALLPATAQAAKVAKWGSKFLCARTVPGSKADVCNLVCGMMKEYPSDVEGLILVMKRFISDGPKWRPHTVFHDCERDDLQAVGLAKAFVPHLRVVCQWPTQDLIPPSERELFRQLAVLESKRNGSIIFEDPQTRNISKIYRPPHL